MSSLATVYVRLLDVNDNNPQFPAHPSLYHVSEDAAIGHVVTTITGTDADVGNFGALFYTLSGVDNDGTFSIIEDTVSNKQPWPCTCLTKQWSSSVISIEFYAQQKNFFINPNFHLCKKTKMKKGFSKIEILNVNSYL